MSENLNKKPPKGILKSSSSFDKAGTSNAVPPANIAAAAATSEMTGSMHRKSAKFDEMNIIETLHPADKDYGHMKIEEPKTPFNYYEDGEDMEQQGIDPHALHKRLESHTGDEKPKADDAMDSTKAVDEVDEDDEEDEDESLDPEERERRNQFESKRKAHYNEYYAVKLARKLLEQEEDEEDNNGTEAVPEPEDSRGGSDSQQGFIPNEELDE